MRLAGADLREDFDGDILPIGTARAGLETRTRTEHINIEYWGIAIPEGLYGKYGDEGWSSIGFYRAAGNNTYKGLRLIGDDFSLYYSVWCTGEKQFYDLKVRHK